MLLRTLATHPLEPPSPPHTLSTPHFLPPLPQDSDSGVREAASESSALLARGLSEAPSAVQPQSPSPLLRMLCDCLSDGKRETQAAGAVALGLSAPFLGHLDAALCKDLVRKLSSPSFHAAPALLGALGSCDVTTGQPEGIIKVGRGDGAGK
eukprot:355609-Chlamydomonas_euryale.AAC.3